VTTERQRSEVSSLGLAALGLALVAFPLFKVLVIDRLPVIERYADSGEGPGLLVWGLLYLGGEAVIAAMCVLSVRREGRPITDIGLAGPPSPAWWIVLAGALVASGVIIVLRHLDVITIMGRPGEDYGALAARATWQRVVIVGSSALAVLLEETVWRGFAVTRLRRLGAVTWLAVLLPSLAFGYFHGGTLDTLWISAFITLAAAGLCVLFLRTGSLAWPMLIHFSWNVLFVALTPQPV
jgi:membrane protease YdiL (CAAX protease family)